jgi:hypothetical protein
MMMDIYAGSFLLMNAEKKQTENNTNVFSSPEKE